MALVWVTGIAGVGKSTVCAVLQAQGHPAVDARSAEANPREEARYRRLGATVIDGTRPAVDVAVRIVAAAQKSDGS